MDFRKLQNFVVLAEELNFSRAAEKVNLTQSALSRSIGSLEEALGARLFDRSTNNVLLTPVGKILLRRAQSLLFDLGSLKQEVRLMAAGETGEIAMGVGPFPGSILLPPILTELVNDKPLVHIDIEINNPKHLLEHLLNEQIEFFVSGLVGLPPESRISIRTLGRLYLGFVVRTGHPLVVKRNITPRDILDYPMVSVRMFAPVRDSIREYFRDFEERETRPSIVCDNPALVEFVTRNSNAVAITTLASVDSSIKNGDLVALSASTHANLSAELGIVTLKGRTLSPSAIWLIERLKERAFEFSKSMPPRDTAPTSG